MPILLDIGFLLALFDRNDRFREAVIAAFDLENTTAIVPDVTLVEATFLVRRAGDIRAAIQFLDYFERANFQLDALQRQDIRRAREIMTMYADARLDFVDTCVIAIAERLAIRQIGTVDRRDFTIVRPAHVDHWELLP